MNARELLTELKQKGVDIKANGDRLVIDAPKGAITPELRASLAAHKSELLKIVTVPAAKEPAQLAKSAAPAPESAIERPTAPIEREPLSSSVAEEIRTLEQELERLRTEEVARRAEIETARLAAEHVFQQERDRWRQEQEEAARRRAEQEKLRIEAEARDYAAEETRRRIAEEELKRVEGELKRMRAMEESRRAEVEGQFKTAAAAHDAELERIRATEAEHVRARAEQEHRFLDAEARKRIQEDELRRRAQTRIAAVEEEILRLHLREEARTRSAEEIRMLADQTERQRAEEEARRQAEAASLRRAEDEARLRAEIEAQMRSEAENRRRAEEEQRKHAEEAARQRAQEEAQRLAAEQAQRFAEEQATRRAQEEQRRRSEEQARLRAAEEAKVRAQQEARLRAEREAQQREQAEQRQRAELEARIRAEVEVKLRVEEAEQALLEDQQEETRLSQRRSSAGPTEWFHGEDSEFEAVSVPESLSDSRSVVGSVNDAGNGGARARAAAVAKLASSGTDEAFYQISTAFDDSSLEVRNAAAQALYNFQEDRAAAFTRALRDAPLERRARIGAAIASSGLANEAINNLTGESRDKTYDAFSLLFLMSKSGEVNPLLHAIEEHPSTEARLAVVKLLALSGQPEVLPAFRRMAVRGSLPPEVRSAVMEAIYQISSQSGDTEAAT